MRKPWVKQKILGTFEYKCTDKINFEKCLLLFYNKRDYS